ncbi:glycoside hydrolase family 65 protein [Methyloferula stellata]|uniref:glycoside hydrolase family 65 protein n=1 Tax=Methyloferula stellata TaxID=876270 RepID=UPI00036945DC|nr:glycosyl hydrolase family 65 protein [Methyloferula stellata]
MEKVLKPTADTAWVLDEKNYDPLRESSSESRFAISNGFLGVRGTREITRCARWVIPPRTYVAGLFDSPGPEQPIPGLVPAADWLQVDILLRGQPLTHHAGHPSLHRMTLDMKRGVLLTECHFKAPSVSLNLRTLRLASLSARALGLQLIKLEVEDGEAEITLEASFEGLSLGLVSQRLEQDLGVWRTSHSNKGLAMAAACWLQLDGRELAATALGQFKWSWSWTSRPGQVALFERLVAVTRSDSAGLDPGVDAVHERGVASNKGWRGVMSAHEAAWAHRWQCSDVEVDGDPAAQSALRFAIYHMNSAANPDDEHVSIGARALTGDDYRGHVFWDTEIFLLPFYCFTWPEAARALLMYRFRTLAGARAKAAGMGWRGALYAWESTDSGVEETPEEAIGPDRKIVNILCGKQEQHISADVAYAVWQYWLATSDDVFLCEAGAQILFETARFWSSRAKLEADGRHHIRGVIGPDEYHEHIDDNAFTNVMARWNIRRALEAAALLRERWPEHWVRISGDLKLDDDELQQWSNVADTMATGVNAKTGMFEQFTGFFDLEDINLATYAGRSVPMDVVLGRERIAQSQVIKQADVVALLGLLPEEFIGKTGANNFSYYEPRCSHGSSLSRAMHGLVAARLGYAEKALNYFRQSAAIDLADTHVAIAGGVHIAALGGLWMTAVFGFAGVALEGDNIRLEPQLPAGWVGLGFRIQWRKRRLKIKIEQAHSLVEVTLESGAPMTLLISGEGQQLSVGKTVRIVFKATQKSKVNKLLSASSAA